MTVIFAFLQLIKPAYFSELVDLSANSSAGDQLRYYWWHIESGQFSLDATFQLKYNRQMTNLTKLKSHKKWVSSFNNFFGHVIGRNAFTGGVFFAQSLEWIEFDITDDRLANNSLTICSFDHSHSIFNELNLLFLTVLLFKVCSKSKLLSKLALWIARDSWICRMRTNTFLLKKIWITISKTVSAYFPHNNLLQAICHSWPHYLSNSSRLQL